MFRLVLEKAEEPEHQLVKICWIIEKGGVFQRNIYFCFIDHGKAFDCVDHNKLENLKNSAVATGLEKVSFHSNPKQRQCQECSNYHPIALISHTSKVKVKESSCCHLTSQLTIKPRARALKMPLPHFRKAMPKNAQTTTQLHSSPMLVK